MDLSALLSPDSIRIGLAARDKMSCITEMVDFLVAKGRVPAADRDAVLKAVVDRENSLSTGMEHGIALPHGSVDCVPEPVGALGISREGIEFATLDGRPAHLVACLLVPRAKTSRHVRTLAGIARLLNNESLRASLLAAKTPGDAMAVIRSEEAAESLEP